MKLGRFAGIAAGLLAACLSAGCSSPKNPLYIDQAFRNERPERIVVLPVVDSRFDTDGHQANLERLQSQLASAAESKGYEVRRVAQPPVAEGAAPVREHLANEDDVFRKAAGVSDAPCLLARIESAESDFKVLAGSCSATVSAVLFDPRKRTILWANRDHAADSGLGLIPALFASDRDGAIEAALSQLMRALPDREGEIEKDRYVGRNVDAGAFFGRPSTAAAASGKP